MSVKISTTNSKLGVIPSVNLTPILTCRPNCPCADECYATNGRFRFKNVREAMAANYAQYKDSPEEYFDEIANFIDDGVRVYSYFRWHSAGDIVDKNYFLGMVGLAKKLTSTSFLAFTKKYEIINEYIDSGGRVPNNLHIVFSAWKKLKPPNPHNFPVAYVRFSDDIDSNYLIPDSAMECSGNCTNCLRCWNIRPSQSVVFNKH